MKKVVLGLFAVAFVLAGAVSAQAQVFKLSLWDKICVPNGDYTGGLELAIGTQTKEVEGVQFGFIYAQADKFTGVQWGIVTNTDNGTGLQWGFVNLAQEMQGIQWGGVNWVKGSMVGAQLGFVNYTEQLTGLQWGAVNYAKDMKGLQLGFFNWADHMNGLQIGFINVIKDNPSFLPVFVIFNFCF